MSTKDSKRNPLTESGILLAVATSIFYCSSYAHYSGFLLTLDLDQNVLDRNFQQILYDGFLRLASLKPVIAILIFYPALRFLYSHSTLPGINLYLRKSISHKKKFLRLRRRWFGGKRDSEIERMEKSKTIKIMGCCIAFIAFIATLAYFEAQGKRQASAILDEIHSHQLAKSHLIEVKIGDSTRSLVFLTCGARNCAGMDPDNGTVHYFPQNGHSFVFPLSAAGNGKSETGS